MDRNAFKCPKKNGERIVKKLTYTFKRLALESRSTKSCDALLAAKQLMASRRQK